MADDKMKNQDQRNMGGQGQEAGNQGGGQQQSPGRNPQDDKSTGQRQGSGNERDDDSGEGQGQGGGRGEQGGQRQ